MFKNINSASSQKTVSLFIDGEQVQALVGSTLASAMLMQQQRATRSSAVSGESRGAFCLMGACFECLVEVNGIPNQQSCMIEVAEGMLVQKQQGPSALQGEHFYEA